MFRIPRSGRVLTLGLALHFLLVTQGLAEITSVTYPVTAFRPNEPGPTRSTQAELSIVLDASPSRYRLDVFRQGGNNALVGTRTVEHTGSVGAPQTHAVRVPLEEGANSFTTRAVDLNQPRFARTGATTPILTRDLRNTVTAIQLDRIEPLSGRVTSQTTAELVYTISGISDTYAVEVEQNGVVVQLEPGKPRGESRILVTLQEGENFFRVRATSSDPLSSDPQVTSKALRMLRDTTPPTLTGVILANPPMPTTQAVVSIQGNTEAFAVVRVTDGQGNVSTKRADQLGNFSFNGVDLPLVFPGPTTTLYQVTATDEAGNVSATFSLPATRVAGTPRFEFIRLTPFDGAEVEPDVAAQIDGLVGQGAPPYSIRFSARRGAALPVLEETIQVVGDGTAFQKDLLLTEEPATPGQDVLWSFEATASTSNATTPAHFLGALTVDFTDPGAITVLDTDLDGVPIYGSRSFTVEGVAERRSSVQFVGFNGVRVQPSGLVPTSPSFLAAGGEFRAVVDLSGVADGAYSLSTTVIATSGRTGLGSRRDLLFKVDRTPPRIVNLAVNGVDAEVERDIFLTAGNLATLLVKVDEFLTIPPEVYVTQQGAEAVRAVFTGAPVAGRHFEYLFAADNSQNFDGPVEVVVLGGEDRGGNVVYQERRFPQAFVVDTRAPILDDLRSSPLDGSLITGPPGEIRITMVEPVDSVPPVSGPDPAGSSLTVMGPLETDPTRIQTGVVIPFDSVTLEFVPAPGSFTEEGTYQVEILARDRAGNTRSAIFLYVLDTTPPPQAFVLRTQPSAGQILPTTGLPVDPISGRQFVSASFEVGAPDDLDLARSRISLRSGCPVPFDILGTLDTVLPDTRRLLFDTDLVGGGSQDGIYNIQVFAADPAGNLQRPVNVNFTLDNVPPVALTGLQRSFPGSPIPTTESIFPLHESLVSGPLLQVSSLIQDGVAVSGFTGSGINTDPLTGTSLVLTLLEAHPTATIPPGTSTAGGIITTMTFEVLDQAGASPCFLGNRQSRALIGLFPDPLTGDPAGLPADGSYDGVWQLETTPVDLAGNVGARQVTRFTYDTVPPVLELDRVRDGRVYTGNRLILTGRARDNDKGPLDQGKGLKRVQVRLEAQGPTGIVTLPPLIDFTDVTLTPSPRIVPAEAELPWRVNLRIPAYSGLARLVVRAEDQAGNETLLVRQLILDVQPLPPPRLLLPANHQDQPGSVVTFDWEHVEGASFYELILRDESDNETVYRTDFPFRSREVNLGLMVAGRYTWTVVAVDTGGTRGEPALARTFLLDRTPPEVTEVFAFDGTVPDASQGDIYGAQIRIAVNFSEPMDLTTAPVVFLEPADPQTLPLPVTLMSYQGKEYRGVLQIPMTPNYPDVNGLATVRISGARDSAGNPIVETRRHLEIDVGPFWEVRAFANPILEREILFYFKARTRERGPLDEVMGFPYITIEQEKAVRPRVMALRRLGASLFYGTYSVDQTLPGNALIRITGADLQGNSSTRTLFFSIAAITRAARTRFQGTSSALQIFLPPGAVTQDRVVTMLPAKMEGEPLPAKSHPELELVRSLDKMVPGSVPLAKSSLLEVDLEKMQVGGPETWPGLGIYLRSGEGYRPLPGELEGGKLAVVLDELGTFLLMRDPLAPRLKPTVEGEVLPGKVLEMQAEEFGSGLDPSSLRVTLGSRRLNATLDAVRGRLRIPVPQRVRAGDQIEVQLADMAGNLGRSSFPVVVGAGLVTEASLYPNPARGPVHLRVRLPQAVQSLRARIYDAAGQRIRDLHGGTQAGRQRMTWDLRSRRGRRVRNGVYFVVVEVTGSSGARERRRLKLAVLR
jgi:hypothetical protein